MEQRTSLGARIGALLKPARTPDISSLDPGRGTTRGARVLAAVKTFTQPRWLLFHLIMLALATAMTLLGRWQLDVSNSKHFDWQNFGYSIQWWAFTAFALFLWVRVMQHHVNPPADTTVSTGLVLASRGQLALGGPAELLAPDTAPGQEPVVYRGYVMPQSSAAPVRSHGDAHHDSYNDYLWQLAMADGATPAAPLRTAGAYVPGEAPVPEEQRALEGPAAD